MRFPERHPSIFSCRVLWNFLNELGRPSSRVDIGRVAEHSRADRERVRSDSSAVVMRARAATVS